jgi:hypothetical protein
MRTPPHEMLRRLRAAAQEAGMQCLFTEWMDATAMYAFQCINGHQFTRQANTVYAAPLACKECRDQEMFQRAHHAAQAKGGKCLEDRYLGGSVPHRFVCTHGHEWAVIPYRVAIHGSWCKQCAIVERGRRKALADGLERLQHLAAQHGGICLSDVYTTTAAHYRFRCDMGHEWETAGHIVLAGGWCRQCECKIRGLRARLTDGLARLQQIANDKGGDCLTEEYAGTDAHYRFRCQNGHEWDAIGNKIVMGSWCMTCIHDSYKLRIELMHQIAQERGGMCLSDHYVNARTKLEWECHRGHRWHARPNGICSGAWCPECAHLNKVISPTSKAREKYQLSRRHSGEQTPH